MSNLIKIVFLAAVLFDLAASAAEAKELPGGPFNPPKFEDPKPVSGLPGGSTR